MALHCWTLFIAGSPSVAIHHHSTVGRLQFGKKEGKKGCLLFRSDKQNSWHCYRSMSIRIVHFFSRGSGVRYSILLSLILSLYFGMLSLLTPVLGMYSIYFVQKMCFHLLYHLLAHFNCLEQSPYPEVSASH